LSPGLSALTALQARIDDDDPEVTDKRPLDMPEMPEMLSIVPAVAGGRQRDHDRVADRDDATTRERSRSVA